jgi:hypothetical protein
MHHAQPAAPLQDGGQSAVMFGRKMNDDNEREPAIRWDDGQKLRDEFEASGGATQSCDGGTVVGWRVCKPARLRRRSRSISYCQCHEETLPFQMLRVTGGFLRIFTSSLYWIIRRHHHGKFDLCSFYARI